MTPISVHQAVFADLDELAQLFDLYRVFQGRPRVGAKTRSF